MLASLLPDQICKQLDLSEQWALVLMHLFVCSRLEAVNRIVR